MVRLQVVGNVRSLAYNSPVKIGLFDIRAL